MDADVYGPSLPLLTGVSGRPDAIDKRIQPLVGYDLKLMSMGFFLTDDSPVIWRGPMVHGLVRQFLTDVDWGELDYLVVDCPPGTGDAALTLTQQAPLSGAVIVTTPQDVALADAVRGITMFQKLGVPLLGLVENMAYYELPDGSRDPVFGEGGGVRLAASAGTELLGQVPLLTAIRKGGDQGLPAALGSDGTAQSFQDIAARVAALLPVDP